ncbi:hypothetical protein HMPREF2767_02865 [Nosocomiicoccus sp. HMSC067E10]|uniref:hypothetical protein n=1 Tax=Nosocomiicoccus sp. HMSC067E10 TaxID=1739271 RepID=UPI0008A188D0|nr:hypothetical protein [Nosocomiicoccus sp. HMSC067E10]OFL47363.1 hypothetical protein HMPREF2767_02865 [Nosocomiicoccus sp. HMSC067E10]
MSLLDRTQEKYQGRSHQNPLANEQIKLDKLKYSTVRVPGDLHSQILALRTLYAGEKFSNEDVIRAGINAIIESLNERDKKDFDRYFEQNVEDKVEVLKRQNKY